MRVRATLSIHNGFMVEQRERLGLTQAELAAQAGVKQGFVSDLERFQYRRQDRSLEIENIAQVLGLTPEQICPPELHGQQIPFKRVAFGDIPVNELANMSRKHIALPSENMEREELASKLNRLLKTLTHREEEIIKLRYGLNGEGAHTLQEIGHIFQVSRSWVGQVEAKAIRKLQHPRCIKCLSEYS